MKTKYLVRGQRYMQIILSGDVIGYNPHFVGNKDIVEYFPMEHEYRDSLEPYKEVPLQDRLTYLQLKGYSNLSKEEQIEWGDLQQKISKEKQKEAAAIVSKEAVAGMTEEEEFAFLKEKGWTNLGGAEKKRYQELKTKFEAVIAE